MRPETMDAVFAALAHRDRRRILDLVIESPGITVGDVCACFATHRIVVMKHMKSLEEAGLLVKQKDGRFRRLYCNTVPIQMIYDRWTSEYSRLWSSRMTDLKYRIEGAPTGEPDKEHDDD